MKCFLLIALVACGGSSGGSSKGADAAPDSKVFIDAPPNVAPMIKIGGTASEDGQSSSTPLAGVAISIYKVGDDATPLATATTDAQGMYSVMVPTEGHVVDAYIKASKSGYTDNISYPAAPFQADTQGANANMITTNNFGFLKLLGGGHDGNGLIVVEILDASSMSVMGATVTSSPAAGAYKYSDSSGTPTATTGTNTDGAAFMFDVPPGQVQIQAMKPGMTFKAHGLVARADVFTTTLIDQQ